MIAEEKADPWNGFVPLGGGVDNLVVKTLVVEGTTAVLQGRMSAWSKMGQDSATGEMAVSQPHNYIDFTSTLILQGKRWRFPTSIGNSRPGVSRDAIA